jgi:DNA polymerase III delta subunit
MLAKAGGANQPIAAPLPVGTLARAERGLAGMDSRGRAGDNIFSECLDGVYGGASNMKMPGEVRSSSHPGGAAPGFVLHPLMILAGSEIFLRRQWLVRIREALFAKENPDLGQVRMDAALGVGAILNECRLAGMFASRKLVVVDPADAIFKSPIIPNVSEQVGTGAPGEEQAGSAGGDESQPQWNEVSLANTTGTGTSARDLILRYAESPCETSVLVLACQTWLKTTRLHKFLEKQGAILWCLPPREEDLPHWLATRCQNAYGKKLAPAAATCMVDLVGPDLARLDSELDKLALYARNMPAITPPMVEELVGFQHERQVWGLIDALAADDVPRALARHEELWRMDANIRFTLVGAIFYWLGQVLRARELLDRRLSDALIIRELHLWPAARATRTLTLARRWGLAGCRRVSGALLAVDLAAKTSVGDSKRNMERFIVELCGIPN